MTQKEARALLNIDDEQDLEEQLENALFEYKQKIYRQLDQVLLYPKWMTALQRLHSAAKALGFAFPEDQNIPYDFEVLLSPKASLVTNFNTYQQVKSKVAQFIYNGSNPTTIITILDTFLRVQRQSFLFWTQANLPRINVMLSQQFDPQALLFLFKSLESQGVVQIEQLNEETTPIQLQEWIAWQKAMLQKMKDT